VAILRSLPRGGEGDFVKKSPNSLVQTLVISAAREGGRHLRWGGGGILTHLVDQNMVTIELIVTSIQPCSSFQVGK